MLQNLHMLALGAAIAVLLALVWSIARPDHRIWPPRRYSRATPFIIWPVTMLIFGMHFLMGLIGWGSLSVPDFIRFSLGPVLFIAGNYVVWRSVARFGVPQTGGDKGALITDGFYRYSRNPQYMADCAILLGWLIISASAAAVPLTILGCLLLLVAPLAEEPWMRETYGQDYLDYCGRVGRYL